jgi:hypothetical protein
MTTSKNPALHAGMPGEYYSAGPIKPLGRCQKCRDFGVFGKSGKKGKLKKKL